jgi:hypothetical protein
MTDNSKERRTQKLKIINDYPKTDAGKRKVSEVRRAAFLFFRAKSKANMFLALSDLNIDWLYRTNRIQESTGLTLPQISKAKKALIECGAISIDDIADTLKINYEIVLAALHGQRENPKSGHSGELQQQKRTSGNEEIIDDTFPPCLGGGSTQEYKQKKQTIFVAR